MALTPIKTDGTETGLTAANKINLSFVNVDSNTSRITIAESDIDALELANTNLNSSVIPTAHQIGTPIIGNDIQEMLDIANTSGAIGGCELTDNGNGTISLASGTALVRDSASSSAPLFTVTVPAMSNISLVDNTTNYIYVNYNAGTPIFGVTTTQSNINCMDICLVYIVHRSGTVIHNIDDRYHNVDATRKIRGVFRSFSRFIHTSGGTDLSTAGNYGLAVTAGNFYYTITELPHPAFNTNVAGTLNENVFALYYRDAGTGFNLVTNQKVIDNLKYDDGSGTLADLSTDNKYGVSWVYIINNDPSSLAVVVGQQEYNTLSEANNATEPTEKPSLIEGLGSLIGFVVYNRVDTTFSNTLSIFTTSFKSNEAQTHNALVDIQGGAPNDYLHITQDEYNKKIRLGWVDNVQPFSIGTALKPVWADIGNNLAAWAFSINDEAFVSFHVNHDYAVGTLAYPHIHWMSTTAIAVGQQVTWNVSYTKARGHAQGDSLTNNLTSFNVTYTAGVGGAIAGEHQITESTIANAFDLLEPDTLILMKIKLISKSIPGNVCGLLCDLHYQTDMSSTINKSPNFYA